MLNIDACLRLYKAYGYVFVYIFISVILMQILIHVKLI